jgi:hypothetical protein
MDVKYLRLRKIYQRLPLQDPPKFTRKAIFGLKMCHLAILAIQSHLGHEDGLGRLLDEILELALVRVGGKVVHRTVARRIEQAGLRTE